MSTPSVPYYPVLLDLRRRRAVVIGGGRVAEQKIEALVVAGAAVTVIAPRLSERLTALAVAGTIAWAPRPYRQGDLDGAFLAVAATDSPELHRRVFAEAELRAVPLNAVDDISNCSVILPSVHRDGDLVVAVSTGGKAPAVAVRLREKISALIGDGYDAYLELLGSLRPQVTARFPTFEERRRVWYRIADSSAIELVRAGHLEAARRLVLDLLEEAA
ncbi:MAG: precorrin-2 dehydrogenase/sirohydrochlorin ferrochelatase family protein [Acidimicrobiia bacterium]